MAARPRADSASSSAASGSPSAAAYRTAPVGATRAAASVIVRYPGAPARWRMLRRATAMIVFVGLTAPDVTNEAPSAT